jgi:hypothetical protein
MKTWWRRIGTPDLPIRQSLLNEYASQNGCPRRFFFRMEEELASGGHRSATAPWKRTLGQAIHATIERALLVAGDAICAGRFPLRERVLRVLGEELLREADGTPVDWSDASPAKEMDRAASMVLGAFRTLSERAARIVGVEVPFSVEAAGYHAQGEIDLLFAPKDDPSAIELVDWKSGTRKLEPVVRDYGVQLGIYGLAVRDGILWPGTERETHFGVAPRTLWICHLRDFTPYERPPRKALAGQPRGPGWYAARRGDDSEARLRVSLRTIVGSIRMGHRVENLGEQCGRCPYRGQCLTDGAGPTASETREIERALDGVDLSDVIPDVA